MFTNSTNRQPTCWFCGFDGDDPSRGPLFEWVYPEDPKMSPFDAHADCPAKNGISGELIRKEVTH